MNFEMQDIENLTNNEITNEKTIQEIGESVSDVKMLMSGGQAGVIAYGIHRISEIPEVKDAVNEKIEDCKEYFNNTIENTKDAISDLSTKISDGIKDYCCGVYADIKDFFTHEDSHNLSDVQFPEVAKLNEGITEGREFGLDKCTEAALEIFNPGVIAEWGNMTLDDRKGIACMYADKVAEAFDLENYAGVYIEEMDPGILGSNNGDGKIHISEQLVGEYTTPFEIMDTITHELRHQYQSECINGFHDVTDEVRNEWSIAKSIYNYDQPSCYDPWGYSYNPLEIDSNYAGNTVVRNVTSQMFNDVINNA